MIPHTPHELCTLWLNIKSKARALGFTGFGITDTDLTAEQPEFLAWLNAGFHGDMAYMAKQPELRFQPELLHPNTVRIISVRMPYLPADSEKNWAAIAWQRLEQSDQAYISLYARGRDYHKVLRQRLQRLADEITGLIGDFSYRVFTDSAPVMEVTLAKKAQLGWRGKHSLLLTRQGSMHFIGELFTDLPLPTTEALNAYLQSQQTLTTESQPQAQAQAQATHAILDKTSQGSCGRCTACMDICPTQAIVAPGVVDARRCISYLTIELKGSIPLEFRHLIGNRIYGCDDCQLICPWNKFAQPSDLGDFSVRPDLKPSSEHTLLFYYAWDESSFLEKMQGSPIRRIGYERWIRNITIALGNALRDSTIAANTKQAMMTALKHKHLQSSPLIQEHIEWAIMQAHAPLTDTPT